MKRAIQWLVILIVIVGFAPGAAAQFDMNMPKIRGIWNPAVGSGAAYEFDGKEGRTELEYAILGTENMAGKTGQWMEMYIKAKGGEEIVIKTLMVQEGDALEMKRMIMQAAGEDPMEFPVQMMGQGGRAKQDADISNDAVLIGTETITVPAGTFTCKHYRAKDNSSDVWVADNAPPWGLVKMTAKDGNLTLIRLITNPKSRIRGTPKKFDPMEMMRQRP